MISQLKVEFNHLVQRYRLYFGSCDLCGSNHIKHTFLCQHCLADLPLFNYQAIGGSLVAWPATHQLIKKQHFDQLYCLAPYIWPFNFWLQQYKYHGRFQLYLLFADLLTTFWQTQVKSNNAPTALATIPIHLSKWQQRGYNQCHLIAKQFAQNNKLIYLRDLLIKTNNDSSQVGKTGQARRNSLRNSFALGQCYEQMPKELILFDDVITTGTTINEVSLLLKQQGVEKINVLTIAISLPPY